MGDDDNEKKNQNRIEERETKKKNSTKYNKTSITSSSMKLDSLENKIHQKMASAHMATGDESTRGRVRT